MSGHNKWSSIKHKKGKADAQRGKAFTKITRELITAARIGGGDPGGNARLRAAMLAARAVNMPNDNIQRAIKKGTGELEGVSYEEYMYEGYGPHGVAVLVKVLTDNKNRTVADLRHTFTKYNGNLGETGCVNWMFDKKGTIRVLKEAVGEERLMELALDLAADDAQNVWANFDISDEDMEAFG